MDTIRYLLGMIIKLVLSLFIIVFFIWAMKTFYPTAITDVTSLVTGSDAFKQDWLPAPRNVADYLPKRSSSTVHGVEFVPGPAFNSAGTYVYQTNYVTYGSSTSPMIPRYSTSNTDRALYIRNTSAYQGMNVSYGTRFIGEARDTMFRNGSFNIFVVDTSGRIVGSAKALDMGTWAAPGWRRFQAIIGSRLPSNIPCALVFQSAQQTTTLVSLRVMCN